MIREHLIAVIGEAGGWMSNDSREQVSSCLRFEDATLVQKSDVTRLLAQTCVQLVFQDGGQEVPKTTEHNDQVIK